MKNDQRKRSLEAAFDREVKRTKVITTGKQKDDESLAQTYHQSATTTFTFLPYHLSILKSLYFDDQENKSEVWDQISDFLSHRYSLLRKNSNCVNLSELVEEATKVSRKASSMEYKSTSMNVTEPRTNSNTSLSFITQSQLAQKLSLTSPLKSDIHDKALSTYSFHFQPMTRERYQYPHQQQNKQYQYLTHQPNHLYGHYHRNTLRYTQHMTTSTTTIQSMNLVMALLRKQHQRSVDTSKQESRPFLPLLDMVRKEVQSLTLEINQLKSNYFENNIRRDEVSTTNTMDEVLLAAGKIDDDGKEEESMNTLSSLLCKRGLWKALGHSLEMVLFQEDC